MTALAYLYENGLEAEVLKGERIAIWPDESITPAMEVWIAEHKAQLIAELKGRGQNPDELLLEIAQTLQASPARLRGLLDSDDLQDIAEGATSRANLLAFFQLKQQTGELLADDTPETDSRPGHVELMQAWKPAHDAMINHLMDCNDCYAPRARYCTTGADIRREYLQTYQNANQTE